MTSSVAMVWLVGATSIAVAAVVAAVLWGRAAHAAARAVTLANQENLERIRSMETSGRLAADLAHHLNDLLTGIAGHAELLIVGMGPAAPGLPDAREIFQLATGGARLTKPLRALDTRHRGSTAANAAADGRSPAAVLVVEDEPGVRELIRALLARAGHEVVVADGPRAARAALGRAPAIGAMIVDLVMPEMGGYELAAEARVAAPDLPVIFISGFAPDPARQSRDDRFLAKPFSVEALTAAVADALALRRSRAPDLP